MNDENQITVGTVFLAFLRLGLTSFGGPVAHIGYFHDEFVVRRKWLEERAYADLVALCQFLPGPRVEPGWHWYRAVAGRSAGCRRRLDRVHHAVRYCTDPVRVWGH